MKRGTTSLKRLLPRVLMALVLCASALAVVPEVSLAEGLEDPNQTVYVSPKGRRYHLYYNCEGLSEASSISTTRLGQVSSARTLCKYCEKRYRGGEALPNSSTVRAQVGWVNSGGRWWYRNADGSYPANAWAQIGGAWYRFDASGYMLTGWYSNGGTWYYLDPSGAMATGWRAVNGAWYYFYGSGAMAIGWLNLNGSWYYLSGSGAMATGWVQVGGYWYWMSPSNGGAMVTGWLDPAADKTGLFDYEVSNPRYHLRGYHDAALDGCPVGSMSTGWASIPELRNIDAWGYFDADGTPHNGWLRYGGYWYYIGPTSSEWSEGRDGWSNLIGKMRKSYIEGQTEWIGGYRFDSEGHWVA